MLTAEDRVVLGHGGLDEGVAHSGDDDLAALGQTTSGTTREVILLQTMVAPGSRASSWLAIIAVIADGLTTLAALVDDEATIGVAVEDQSKISCMIADRRLRIEQVLGLERVRRVVGEGAVEVEEQADQLKIITAEHRRQGVSSHPVAGVGHHPEPPDAASGRQGSAGRSA